WWFDLRMQDAINAATSGESERALNIGFLLILVALFAFVVRVLSRVVVFNAGRIGEYELRSALLSRLHKLGTAFYQKMPAGEIMSRATNDLMQVRLLLGFGVLNTINTAFGLVSAFAVMVSIHLELTLAALAPLPLLFWVTSRFSSQIYSRQKANQEALGVMSDQVQSSITGTRVMRSFNLEDAQAERFQKANESYLDKSLALARLRGMMGPIMQSITSVGILIVFWYGGMLVVAKELDEGGFVVFFRALARLTWPLMALGFLAGLVARGRAAYARLLEIYSAEPEIVGGSHSIAGGILGDLAVKHLSYSYGDMPVLQDVSFHLPAGGSIAIVGKTGVGKSTLSRLLARLEPAPRGTILLDGTDICDLPLSVVRGSIGYAQQNPFLFSTTAGRNIGFSLDEPDSAPALLTIEQAARKAH